jgi:hypothetical protein
MAQVENGIWTDGDGEFKSPTRADYLNGKVTHHEYYSVIAAETGIAFDPTDALVQRAMKCTDQMYFNTTGTTDGIPMPEWDRLALRMGLEQRLRPVLKAHGDSWSNAGETCVLKTAVRNAIQQAKAKRPA